MVGNKNGVTTKLKEINPYLIAVHCNSHRLSLVCSTAAKHIPYLRLIYEPALISIWSLFHFSAQRWERMKAHFASLKEYVDNVMIRVVIFFTWSIFYFYICIFFCSHRVMGDNDAFNRLMKFQKAAHTRWLITCRRILP